MKKTRLLTSIAVAALFTATSGLVGGTPLQATPAMAQQVSVSFNLFFNELDDYGVWVRHPQYRYVWCPTDIDADWHPYTVGRWIYLADYGWYFASDEPFAWATYHYGRWLDDDELGWCWVPGTRWAPAWVAWRRSNDYVGWAPLPPEGEGFAVNIEVNVGELPEDRWIFVPVRSFVEPRLRVDIVFGSQAQDIYQQTEFVGPVTVQNNIVVNNVIEVEFIEQQINQDVIAYEVEPAQEPSVATVSVENNTIQVFAEDVPEPEQEAAPEDAVEPEQAAQRIEEERAAAPEADVETEAEVDAGAEADPDAAGEGEAETDVQMQTEGEAEAGAETDADVTEQPTADQPAESTEPAEPAGEEAAEEAPADTEGLPTDEQLCPPEVMVDGECPPDWEGQVTPDEALPETPELSTETGVEAEGETGAETGTDTGTDATVEGSGDGQTGIETEQPATDTGTDQPATEEPVPAPAEGEPEALPEGEGTEGQPLPCPPEMVVDGKCPPNWQELVDDATEPAEPTAQ